MPISEVHSLACAAVSLSVQLYREGEMRLQRQRKHGHAGVVEAQVDSDLLDRAERVARTHVCRVRDAGLPVLESESEAGEEVRFVPCVRTGRRAPARGVKAVPLPDRQPDGVEAIAAVEKQDRSVGIWLQDDAVPLLPDAAKEIGVTGVESHVEADPSVVRLRGRVEGRRRHPARDQECISASAQRGATLVARSSKRPSPRNVHRRLDVPLVAPTGVSYQDLDARTGLRPAIGPPRFRTRDERLRLPVDGGRAAGRPAPKGWEPEGWRSLQLPRCDPAEEERQSRNPAGRRLVAEAESEQRDDLRAAVVSVDLLQSFTEHESAYAEAQFPRAVLRGEH